MNIVKLKDVIMPSEYKFSQFFNENLKGRYAYWVQMRYIFPLDSLDFKTYIKYEQMSDVQMSGYDILPHIDLYCDDCLKMNFNQTFIDSKCSEDANSVHEFKVVNIYTTDCDITIDDIKEFRTWLATELLNINSIDSTKQLFNDNQIHMLEYYKNGMYNDVIKILSIFGHSIPTTDYSNTTNCSCCNSMSTNNVLGETLLASCDSVDTYRKNLHKLMYETFSDAKFWKMFNNTFLLRFKKYIDNIINSKLIISNDVTKGMYYICSCNNKSNIDFVTVLKHLSQALQYIIDDNVAGHANYIYDALYSWSKNLYEKMYWK